MIRKEYFKTENNLAGSGVVEELKEQLIHTHYKAADACEDCKTGELIGMGKTACGSPTCTARQISYELARQGYHCQRFTLEDSSVLALLTELDAYGWGWFLTYKDGFGAELSKAPLEDFEPIHQAPQTIPLAELCAEFGWFSAGQ